MRKILAFEAVLLAIVPLACGPGSEGARGVAGQSVGIGSLPETCDFDRDGFADRRCADADADCDDQNPTVHPGAGEVRDGVDQDCDGKVDEGTDAWDADGDCVCVRAPCTGSENPQCGTIPGNDCDDADPQNFPGNAEVCDDRDNDCDAEPDQGLPFLSWWPDADDDGFGAQAAVAVVTCADAPEGTVGNNGDCDDGYADVSPVLQELACDGLDNDCWPDTADGHDDDGDGVTHCYDCDDHDFWNSPANEEVCDGRDNDCTGDADDGLDFDRWYPDRDGDGYGDEDADGVEACAPIPGWADDDDDCNDGWWWVHPGAAEIPCDGVDNDCSGGDRC